MFAHVKKFNKTIWFILGSSFFESFAAQMVWPFMALILYRKFGLNELQIGLYLSFAVFVRAIFGFYVGNLSDRIGRRVIIQLGLITGMTGMVILASADNLWIMLLGSVFVTISIAMVQMTGKALMTDMTDDRNVKDLSLQLKFFSHNAALALGPAFGAYIGISGKQSTFYLVAVVYLLVLLVATYIFKIEQPLRRTKSKLDQSFNALFKLLAKDHAFLMFILANSLILLAYIQVQAGLLQYLRLSNIVPVEAVYAKLMMINGFTIILTQFPLMKLMAKLKPMHKAYIGVSLFCIAYIIYAFFTHNGGWPIYLAMFIMALGEATLFPTIMVIVDRMAPEHLKGSYFGAAGLTSFGVAAAPLVGGYLLQYHGGMALWLTMAFISLTVGFLLYLATKAKRPDVLMKNEF